MERQCVPSLKRRSPQVQRDVCLAKQKEEEEVVDHSQDFIIKHQDMPNEMECLQEYDLQMNGRPSGDAFDEGVGLLGFEVPPADPESQESSFRQLQALSFSGVSENSEEPDHAGPTLRPRPQEVKILQIQPLQYHEWSPALIHRMFVSNRLGRTDRGIMGEDFLEFLADKGSRPKKTTTYKDYVVFERKSAHQFKVGVLSRIKWVIYAPIRNQPRDFKGVCKLPNKAEALQELQEQYNMSDEMLKNWFGAGTNVGLKNGMIDYLFKPEGKPLFKKIMSIDFVDQLIESLNSQTEQKIHLLLQKLEGLEEKEDFLRGDLQHKKMPWSYIANLIACFVFYDSIMHRANDFMLENLPLGLRLKLQDQLENVLYYIRFEMCNTQVGLETLRRYRHCNSKTIQVLTKLD